MEINGVDVSKLGEITKESLLPKVVPGRVLQLDGDCLAYECAGYDDEPFNKCVHNFKAALESRMSMAGASHCNIHLTGGDKGGRFGIAQVKEYQANRKGKVKPMHLAAIREYVMSTYTSGNLVAIMNEHQEADDSMSQEQYKAITSGHPELSVIMSMDKDLGMNSGWHCDWSSYIMEYIDGFGSIYLDESGSSKKIKGKGTSFFWAQLLMGDTADNIPGLPKLGMPMLDAIAPLKKPRTMDAKKSLGPVLAFQVLKDCKNDVASFMAVVKAYQSYWGEVPFEFTTWRGEVIKVTSGHMLLEQAKLLWMRRTVDECPSVFFKQVMSGIKWDGEKI